MHCSSTEYREARHRLKNLKAGDVVTVKTAVPAYYSDYGGRPSCTLEPGMPATVISVDVPYVTGPERCFVLVQFRKFDLDWRAAVAYDNIEDEHERQKRRTSGRAKEESQAAANAADA